MLRTAGYEDGDALSLNATDGELPSGRELSFSWLAGTVMTGLTSVMLMGAALYMAFLGEDTFSTPYDALTIERAELNIEATADSKTDRLVILTPTRSDRELIEASIRVTEDGISRIRLQGFDRIRATLATAKTELAEDIPAYDPVALLNRTQSNESSLTADISTDIYGTQVQGEIVVNNTPLSLEAPPRRTITDQVATEFVRLTLDGAYPQGDLAALGYAAETASIIELGQDSPLTLNQLAQNIVYVPRTTPEAETALGTSERVITVRDRTTLGQAFASAGLTEGQIISVLRALPRWRDSSPVSPNDHLRVLYGPAPGAQNLVPYRVSYYNGDAHEVTVALSDIGMYVTGQAPAAIDFPDEDVEEINVNNLPSIYRSIWETGRKYELDDDDIDRIVAMYAYDLDLTRRISAGDSIEILQTEADDGSKELLYVALALDGVKREFFRHQADDGTVSFFDPNGETGKRFLMRRPLEGGGNLRSRFGYRVHPVFRTRRLHTGVDLAAPTGTPIYAAGDGIIEKAAWTGGYGRYIVIKHVNGYQTGYGHQSRFASGISPGVRVKQGQIIGYVGSTGVSTGPHLHFEIKVNGNFVDPLAVRLPRSNSLNPSERARFEQTVAQIRELMDREITQEVTIASLN